MYYTPVSEPLYLHDKLLGLGGAGGGPRLGGGGPVQGWARGRSRGEPASSRSVMTGLYCSLLCCTVLYLSCTVCTVPGCGGGGDGARGRARAEAGPAVPQAGAHAEAAAARAVVWHKSF